MSIPTFSLVFIVTSWNGQLKLDLKIVNEKNEKTNKSYDMKCSSTCAEKSFYRGRELTAPIATNKGNNAFNMPPRPIMHCAKTSSDKGRFSSTRGPVRVDYLQHLSPTLFPLSCWIHIFCCLSANCLTSSTVTTDVFSSL